MMFGRPRALHLFALLPAGALGVGLWSATVSAQGRRGGAGAADAPAAGAYTGAQAERGKALFITSCGNCHGQDLKGAPDRAPALAGDAFMKTWQSRSVGNLFTKIKSEMPRNRPGSLPDNVYVDIVAFILQGNALPEGPKELSAAVLDSVPMGKGDLKKIVPNFAMVAVVGCLAKGPNDTWMLTKTSEPVQSKDQPATPQELKDAEAQPLGADSFQLISVVPFKPEASNGRKVAAKGLLYRAANDSRLDITSLEPVSSSCAN